MGAIIGTLVRFVGASAKGKVGISGFGQAIGSMVRVFRALTGGIVGLVSSLAGALISTLTEVMGFFTKGIKDALGFELSIKGLLDQAEKARQFFSNLADELAFYTSSTGSTANAMNILTGAAGKSLATMKSLQSAFQSMVDAGADSDQFIKDSLPTLGEFELKTGLAATSFGLFTTKVKEALGEKKGVTKDILNLQKALIGTGLKSAQLEAVMQGLSETIEKLASVTNGSSLNIKKLGEGYGQVVSTFKAFGISAQTSSSFISNLLDPDSIEKNMLLMNKLGISYEEYNNMLNSGDGQDKFFDKILNNIGDVAQEANRIKDAGSRIKYLKDTLGLPPEIANKILKVAPQRMKAELRRIKQEMEEAERRDKWRKDLKAREEKYEEVMNFLRMEMVQPLVELMAQNRDTTRKLAKAIKPIIQGLSEMLRDFMMPLNDWFNGFNKELTHITSTFKNADSTLKAKKITELLAKTVPDLFSKLKESFKKLWQSDGVQKVIMPLAEILGDFIHTGVIYTRDQVLRRKTSWRDAESEMRGSKKSVFVKKLGIEKGDGSWFGDKFDKEGKLVMTTSKKIRLALGAFLLVAGGVAIGGALAAAGSAAVAGMFGGTAAFTGFSMMTILGAGAVGGAAAVGAGVAQNATFGEYSLKNQIADRLKEEFGEDTLGAQEIQNFAEAFAEGGDREKEWKESYDKMQKNLEKKMLEETEKGNLELANKLKEKLIKLKEMRISEEKKEEENKETFDQTNIKKIAMHILNNKDFMNYMNNIFAKTEVLKTQQVENQIIDLEKKNKNLNLTYTEISRKFEKLINQDGSEILKNWENKLIGKDEKSFLSIFTNISKATDQMFENIKQKILSTQVNDPKLKINQIKDFEIYSTTAGGSVNIRQTSSVNSLINSAMSSNVDLETKEILFLKSAADSTYDAAMILKYIGRNLIFSDKGLHVSDKVISDYENRLLSQGGSAALTNWQSTAPKTKAGSSNF